MRIVDYTGIDKERWDEFVVRSNNAWLFHLSDWIEIEKNQGFKSYSFALKSETGEIIAIFPLYLSTWKSLSGLISIRKFHTGHARSGPALLSSLSDLDKKDIWQKIISHIRALVKSEKIDVLEIRLPTLSPSNLPPLRSNINPLFYFGFEPLMGVSRKRLILLEKVICLEQSIESIWEEGISDPCKRIIRQAQKHNFNIYEANNLFDISDYYLMHIETYLRTRAKPRTKKYFENLWNLFGKKYMTIFFVEHNGVKIASLMIFHFKSAVTFWAACSKTDYLNLRPNDMLQWHAITWAKNRGYKWYEVGPFFPYLSKEEKMYRIGKFKEKFGGEVFYLYEGQEVYSRGKFLLLDALYYFRDILKNKIYRLTPK